MLTSVRRSLKSMTDSEKTRFWGLLVFRSLASVLDVAGVVLVGLIAAIAASGISQQSTVSPMLSQFGLGEIFSIHNLLAISLVTLVFFILKAALAVDAVRRQNRLYASVEARTAKLVVQGMLSQPRTAGAAWSEAELNFGVTISMNAAFGRLLSYFSTVVAETFLLICIGTVLLIASPLTSLVVVVYFGIVGFAIQFFVGSKHQKLGAELAESSVDSTQDLYESISAFREIYVLGKQPYFVNRFGRDRSKMAFSGGKIQFIQALPRYIVELALIIGIFALVASQMGSSNVVAASATLGIFLTAGMRIVSSVLPLQTAAGSIRQVSSEAELANSLVNEFVTPSTGNITKLASPQEEPRESPNLQISQAIGAEVRNISYRYPGAQQDAITDVSFCITPGQFFAIIGPSGSGKSTLADLLLGLLEPNSGRILVSGASPRELESERHGVIAYVPQKPGIIAGTIAQNVALGVQEDAIDYELVHESLRLANLEDFVLSLEDGVRSLLGKQVNSLSGGQIQRLGLARALYSQPQLLVLDEATSALDAESEAVIGNSLLALRGKITLVVIAHRLSTIQDADNVLVVENGKVLGQGSFDFLKRTVPMVANFVELMSLKNDNSELEG